MLSSLVGRVGSRIHANPAVMRQLAGAAVTSTVTPWVTNGQSLVPRRRFAEAAATGPAVSYEVKDGIAIFRLNCPGKVNTLSSDLSADFEAAMNKFEGDQSVVGAVIVSAKPDNFIAGADINQLAACSSAEELAGLSQGGQKFMDRLANSRRPIVAAINGSCLGGGLEVALACHYRIATENPKTVMALPEVMLGLLPGAGGTQRLPKLVGLQESLGMALTGKNIRPGKAKKIGLVDMVVDPHALESNAIRAARELANGSLKRKPRNKNLLTKALEDFQPGRDQVWKGAKKQIMKASGGLYPAPLAILECIKTGWEKGPAAGYAMEAKEFGRLGQTQHSQSLIHLFHGQTACKKNRWGEPAEPVNTVAVLGAGLMGAGIAGVSAQKGYNVILKDVQLGAVGRGMKHIYDEINKKVKRKAMLPFERDTVMSRLQGLTDDDPLLRDRAFSNCDVVIEAVFEDMKVKHKVLQSIEAITPEHCVYASNTSSLPISEIAQASKRPDKVVGMHYFSPVEKMPLLEVIKTDKTSDTTLAAAVQVGLKQGKTVIVVGDGPGFYTTRILAPFMAESAALMQDGVKIPHLDSTLKKFGFPVGPVTLLDEVGIDVGAHVAEDLGKAFGERMGGADVGLMNDMVNRGFLGRKSGKGFFLYESPKQDLISQVTSTVAKLTGNGPKGKPLNQDAVSMMSKYVKGNGKFSDKEIQNRMVVRFVNEAILCLEEGIIENPVDGDIGAVFGLGFPPFLGGPFHYVDLVGADTVLGTMEKLQGKYGNRFAPSETLKKYAKDGLKFHKKK